ncbi:MAG TPA: zinc ribbon domain-containing protein YjdM [Polynucleobacter sp.]|nr:MAG: alkylphosphonate utilization protein [Polynucleobacter sp. 16-46-70]HQR83751.1 zinc ribbon domain-containing protein YjdM [Polynucleobacter sp.]HQS61345.1 zinc ribbon domain-containing protein YjdM [Polynucleobacter sp.]HQT20089.1 zinc ribbon domain-containing protein YjdM [Polynucleobacter sp.]HQT41763.1 zinc ribbon domain-containing protein YjdM [Polynucleobacter sp.]
MNASANLPPCPACKQDMIYPDGENYVCAQCGHEWPMAEAADESEAGLIVKDANGNLLADGDSVTLIKDLKVKGSSTTLKVGTKIKGIRLVSGDHEVDCKTEAGNMLLKACFLKKA